ncbi:MAG: N-acetylglucosamine-6-phosphate deacetylase, partial [Hyphomicrobiales bacterium]|nr:N-acetylglucosamine-6-phosphate deacetylase [Hyphomicrobiales bacterium]
VAPERDGAIAFVAAARARGIEVSLGHGAIDAVGAATAAQAGARLSTHLGNACAHTGHKFDNPIFAQLGVDDLTATFIADGRHVPPAVLRAMVRAKGPGRAILVTDAVSAAGAPPGLYRFAGMAIERGADGAVRLPGTSTLAGAALELDQAMRNAVEWGAATAPQALAMASASPRALVPPRLPPSRATFDDGLRVRRVEIDGRTVVDQTEK